MLSLELVKLLVLDVVLALSLDLPRLLLRAHVLSPRQLVQEQRVQLTSGLVNRFIRKYPHVLPRELALNILDAGFVPRVHLREVGVGHAEELLVVRVLALDSQPRLFLLLLPLAPGSYKL